MTRQRRLRGSESGYALLLVYVMAAAVAIMLYNELPSVAFEAQRLQEQLLIDRGEQYQRAITLYVRKNNRFPPDLDALDKTAGQRYLRRRFKDPMTGKDEWRLIHVGPGGVFTDSLVYNKKKSGDQSGPQNFITELQQIGGTTADPNAQGGNLAARHRPGDAGGAPGGTPTGVMQGTEPGNLQYVSGGIPNGATSGLQNGIPNGIPNGVPSGVPAAIPNGASGIPNGYNAPGQAAGQPGQAVANGQPPAAAGQFGLPPGIQFPSGAQQQNYGQAPVQAGSAASNLINQILTTPRANPFNQAGGTTLGPPTGAAPVDQFGNALPAQGAATAGLGGSVAAGSVAAPTQGQTIGGGLAGVASKREREGIKIYRDRTAYNEWEFVYDVTQDKSRQGLGGGGAPTSTPNATPGAAGTPAPASPPPPVSSYVPQGTVAPQPGNVFPQTGVPAAPQPAVSPGFAPGLPPVPPVNYPATQPSPGDQGSNPAYPAVTGQPGLPTAPGSTGATSTAPTAPGGIVPSAPIGGGGIVPSPPVGGGTPH